MLMGKIFKRGLITSTLCFSMFLLSGCGGGGDSAPAKTTASASMSLNTLESGKTPLTLDLTDLSVQVKKSIKNTNSILNCEVGQEPVFDHVLITVSKADIVKTLNLSVGCGNIASGQLDGLTSGNWLIKASIYDASNNELFTANTAVYILPNKTFIVDLPFTFDNSNGTGGAIFNVTINSTLQQELAWTPAPILLPANGNYVYLSSTVGDYIGAGKNYLYKGDEFSLSSNDAKVNIGVQGLDNADWSGGFALPDSVSTLQAGSYTGLTRLPFSNAKTGGLEWTGNGRGCNTSLSWVVIDQATYEAGALKSIDYRFAQHCESDPNNALFGAVHWVSPNASVGTNWQPDPNALPASGNYIYLQSDSGDYIGAGKNYLFTPSTATVAVTADKNVLGVNVNTNTWWNAYFAIPNSNTTLVKGLFNGLTRYPFHDVTVGGLDWSGDGRGCNQETGWVAIDDVKYISGELQSIDVRFEQHCEGGTPALRGKIHWVK